MRFDESYEQSSIKSKKMRLLKLKELLKVKNAFNFSKMLSLFVLFILFSFNSVAQNTTISIKTFSEADCSEDQVVRYYTLDKSEKNNPTQAVSHTKDINCTARVTRLHICDSLGSQHGILYHTIRSRCI